MSTPLPALLLGPLLGLAACRNVSPAGVHVSSEPPGARVSVDGVDSGWVTPCQLALDVEREHELEVGLAGFAPRRILLVPDERRSFVSWNQAVNGLRTRQKVPFLMPADDLLLPFLEVETLAPGRIFVRLRPGRQESPE